MTSHTHGLIRGSAVALFAMAPFFSSTASASDPAAEPTLVIIEGDNVPGVGIVNVIFNMTVNNSGTSLIEVDTNNPDLTIDGAIVQDGPGTVLYAEAQLLASPDAGTYYDTFDAISLNNNGNHSHNPDLGGTPGGSSTDFTYYYNSTYLCQEGSPVKWAGANPGTIYSAFLDTKLNDNEVMLMLGSADDPTVGGAAEYYLATYDSVTTTHTRLHMAGDAAPGTTEMFYFTASSGSCFASGADQNDFNNNGDVIFVGRLTGSTTTDYGVWMNNTLLLREGDLLYSDPTRIWDNINSAEVGINDHGDYVIHAGVSGDTSSDKMILRNGLIFKREGDLHPGMTSPIGSFGSSRVDISDHGDILWYADTTDSSAIDEFVCVNEKVLIQEGVTQVGNSTITQVKGSSDSQRMSDDGRYYLVEVEMTDNNTQVELEGVVRIDRGPWDILGGENDGSNGTPMLRAWGSLAAGEPVSVELNYAAPSSAAHLIIGYSAANVPFSCGLLAPFPTSIVTLPTDANGNLAIQTTMPPGAPSGFGIWMQTWITDAGACFGYAGSNGIKGTTP